MAQYSNWEKFYQKLNIIFHGIVAATMIPFAWIFLETQKEFPDGPVVTGSPGMILNTVLVSTCAVLAGLSHFMNRKSIRQIHEIDEIKFKLSSYLKQKVILYTILESAAFLAMVGLYLSKEHVFTGIYLLVLFFFSLQRPSFDRVSRETGIKQGDLKKWGAE